MSPEADFQERRVDTIPVGPWGAAWESEQDSNHLEVITWHLAPGTYVEHGTYVAPLIRSYLTSVAGFGQVTKTLGNYESPFASYHISLSASDEGSQPENRMRSGNRVSGNSC